MSGAILCNINVVNTSSIEHFNEHHTAIHHMLLLELEEEENVRLFLLMHA
jgi:hypothetical protein